MLLQYSKSFIRHHQVTPKHINILLSKYLRIHNRFTPIPGKPSSYTQIHFCYYYQDLLISPLHTRSRKSFNRIISPSYLILTLKSKRPRAANYIPSIFSKARFGRYVVTRFLADANFHGHRPTVSIKPSDSTSFA